VPQTRNKPFHKAPEFKKIRQLLRNIGEPLAKQVHICVYCAPFGVVPLELDEIYPLSQHEAVLPLDLETVQYVANQTAQYIERNNYQAVTLLNDPKLWSDTITKACKRACKSKGLAFETTDANAEANKKLLEKLEDFLRKQLSA